MENKIEKIEAINMLFVLFSVNFVKELKGSSVDKALTKQEINELLNIVGESINQTIKDMLDKGMLEENNEYIYIPSSWIYKSNEILVRLV